MERKGRGRLTVQCRSSDGACIASECYASYPVRFHLTSNPNNDIISSITNKKNDDANKTEEEEEEEEHRSNRKKKFAQALCCYVLGYGGGLISGDTIHLHFLIQPKSSLVITSQSTSKSFRAISGRSTTNVTTTATVRGDGSLFVFVPQPTQCFKDSKLVQETDVVLEWNNDWFENGEKKKKKKEEGGVCGMAAPSVLLVDWYTGGRQNLDGGLWQFDSFASTTTVSCRCRRQSPTSASEKEEHQKEKLIFRDACKLSGGKQLQRHMMNKFNVVCMVVLIGPRVDLVSNVFLKDFSSRRDYHHYDDDNELNETIGNGVKTEKQQNNDIQNSHNRSNNSTSGNVNNMPHHNRGEGLDSNDDFLVSCGTFQVMDGMKPGVVLRIASRTVEQAASFLSRYISTLDGQLKDDPFMEILVSRQCSTTHHSSYSKNDTDAGASVQAPKKEAVKDKLSFELLRHSFEKESQKSILSKKNISEHNVTSSSSPPKIKQNQQLHTVSPILIYQIVDASAPTGGFAHSNTIEAAHQLHIIKSSNDDLLQYTWNVLLQTATSILPFLLTACKMFRMHYQSEIAVNNNGKNIDAPLSSPPPELIEKWEALDAELTANMTSHVTRRASSLQGSGIFRAFGQMFPSTSVVVRILKRRVLKLTSLSDEEYKGHSATCFGAICGLLGIEDRSCASMFLYTTARDMINAAVRMNIVGPLMGGRLTNEICVRLEDWIAGQNFSEGREEENDEDEENVIYDTGSNHQVAPLVEILAGVHDRLYTRLFNS